MLLLLAAFAVWWFFFRKKPSKNYGRGYEDERRYNDGYNTYASTDNGQLPMMTLKVGSEVGPEVGPEVRPPE